jgi:integrase
MAKTAQSQPKSQVCSGPASWRMPAAPVESNQPGYRRQVRPNGKVLAFVVIAGKRHYLGEYNSPESVEAYRRLMAEIAASSGIPTMAGHPLTNIELAERFVAWAQGYYRKQGHVTAEVANILNSIKPLIVLYGHQPAAEFGPRALKAVRQTWLDQRASRKYINRNVERIRRMFKWAVAEELVPPGIYHGLQAVPGLKYGRSDALETAPVHPAPEELIEPVKRIVSRQVAAMIDLQLLTGARPGEITIMRPMDIDRGGDVWIYRPATHKTEHHGHSRIIPLGPKAQQVIAPFLAGREAATYLFSPIEAEHERMEQRTAHSKTPEYG